MKPLERNINDSEPCPFCGDTGNLGIEGNNINNQHRAKVKCYSCGAGGPQVYSMTPLGAQIAAIKKWNHRPRNGGARP